MAIYNPPGTYLETGDAIDVTVDTEKYFQALWNATTAIKCVSIVNPKQQTRIVKLQPGHNPIAGSKILRAGTTFLANELWAIEEIVK